MTEAEINEDRARVLSLDREASKYTRLELMDLIKAMVKFDLSPPSRPLSADEMVFWKWITQNAESMKPCGPSVPLEDGQVFAKARHAPADKAETT